MGWRTVLFATFAALSLANPAPAQAQRVVVYTAVKQSLVDKLTPMFQAQTGITVQVITAGSGDIIRRVRAEAGAPKVDVIWSIGGEELEASKELWIPYVPAGADMILPAYKISPEWLPFSGILAVFMVNTQSLKPTEYPQSWKDLADPKWKGQIASARADASGSSYQQYATVLMANGDAGWDLYKRILGNMQLADSSGLVPRLVNDGEAKVGITLEDNALDYVKGGGPVAIVYPADGTSTVADGMALAKGAPDAENGKKFLDFLLSKPVQELVVKEMGRRAVRTDVPSGGGARPIAEVKLMNYDIRLAAAKRAEWLARWKEMAAAR